MNESEGHFKGDDRVVEQISHELASLHEEVDNVHQDLGRFLTTKNSDNGQLVDELADVVRKMSRQLDRMERRSFRLTSTLLSEVQALHQLFDRFSPQVTLPAVAGWALNPSGLLALSDLVQASERGVALECGSGTSTLWLAYAVKRKGRGKVVALEHDGEYAEQTRQLLRDHQLSEYVEVVSAPLVDTETSRGVFKWYDVDPRELDLGGLVEVVLIDGPPGTTGPHSRYPAAPMLSEILADGAKILFDDTNREEEREVLDFWIEDGFRIDRLVSPGDAMELLAFAK